MPFTARTMRRMTPTARKLAQLHNDAHRLANQLKRLTAHAHSLDLDAAHHRATLIDDPALTPEERADQETNWLGIVTGTAEEDANT